MHSMDGASLLCLRKIGRMNLIGAYRSHPGVSPETVNRQEEIGSASFGSISGLPSTFCHCSISQLDKLVGKRRLHCSM